MINFFLKSAEYDIRTIVNMILFYFRKIPVLGWLAPGSSYKNERLKSFLVFISPLALLIFSMLKSLFNIGILALVALWVQLILSVFSQVTFGEVFINIVFVAFLLDFTDFYFLKKKDKSLIYYNLFKVDPRTIFLSQHYINLPIKVLGRFFALVILGKIGNFSSQVAFNLALLSYLSASLYNYLNARLLVKKILTEKSLNTWGYISILIMILAFGALVFFDLRVDLILGNIFFKLVLLAMGIIGLVGLWNFRGYSIILNDFSQDYEQVTSNKDKKKEAINKANSLKVEDFEASKAHLRKDLEGYKLLNELFFQRHRRHILKPLIIKAAIAGVVLLGLVFLPHLPIPGLQEEIPSDFGSTLIKKMTGFLPFVAYLIFYNEAITRTMFANCDQALMQYGFYRRPKDLLEMFFLRLKKLAFWNALSLLPFGIFLILMKSLNGARLEDVIILGVQYLALWIFFSVHTLFIYYIFQPYNSAQEPKSPIYFIINLGVYYVCFFTMQLGIEGPLVGPIFIGASIIYSVLALIAVYFLAPKTFKVRVGRS